MWAIERSCKGTFILEMFLCVSSKEKIISEFKNGQHNLENMVIFICDDEFVLMKAMDVKTQAETWQPNGLLLQKNMAYVPLIC